MLKALDMAAEMSGCGTPLSVVGTDSGRGGTRSGPIRPLLPQHLGSHAVGPYPPDPVDALVTERLKRYFEAMVGFTHPFFITPCDGRKLR